MYYHIIRASIKTEKNGTENRYVLHNPVTTFQLVKNPEHATRFYNLEQLNHVMANLRGLFGGYFTEETINNNDRFVYCSAKFELKAPSGQLGREVQHWEVPAYNFTGVTQLEWYDRNARMLFRFAADENGHPVQEGGTTFLHKVSGDYSIVIFNNSAAIARLQSLINESIEPSDVSLDEYTSIVNSIQVHEFLNADEKAGFTKGIEAATNSYRFIGDWEYHAIMEYYETALAVKQQDETMDDLQQMQGTK